MYIIYSNTCGGNGGSIPLSVSFLPSDTTTGTNHASGLLSPSPWPCSARWMDSSLASGGGGTLGSQAMFMKTLRPFWTSTVSLRMLTDAGCRVVDLMQNPDEGERCRGILVMVLRRHVIRSSA